MTDQIVSFDRTDPDDTASDLDALADELQEEIFPPVVVPVPGRPGWGIKVRTNISQAETEQWQKQGGKDVVKGMLLTIVNTCLGIVRNGALVVADGEVQTFATEAFLNMLNIEPHSAAECARKFIGRDADIAAVATAVMRASGFGSTVEAEEDPTSGPRRLSGS